jgi:signal transduction histidine kinase
MMTRFFQSLWKWIISVPLWVKIMGIVVFPLTLTVSAVIFFVRREIILFLLRSGDAHLLQGITPIITSQAGLVLASAIIIGILLAQALSLLLVTPLRQLLNAIQKIEAGDHSARVKVWADDEIGRVQAAFNKMTESLSLALDNLNYRNRELSIVNQVAQLTSESIDINAIIETALSYCMELMAAPIGSIYLLDSTSHDLKLKMILGDLPDEILKSARRREFSSTPMRRVFDCHCAIALSDISMAPELPEEVAQELKKNQLKSWACAPLMADGEVIGTLTLTRNTLAPFTKSDLTLLESIGSVIGIRLTNAQLVEDLSSRDAELHRALRRSVEIQEEERKRLARELHDEVGQALTSILIRLRSLQDETDLETIVDRVDGLRYLTAQSIEELRRISMDLRPAALDNLGIVPALKWYAEQSASSSGLDIQFSGPDKLERLPSETEVVLYRVAQEGINNAIRHADAQSIHVALSRNNRSVWLDVRDDGKGYNPNEMDRGFGLVGIRERVELLHGTCGVESAPGWGTRLWIEIPLQADGTEDSE